MNAIPKRIQRHRTKGWNAEKEAGNGLPVVFVHRPFKFGNPFKAEKRSAPSSQRRPARTG